MFPLNVLLPAIVCVPLVTIPPFEASAGVNDKTPDVITAPLEFELPHFYTLKDQC